MSENELSVWRTLRALTVIVAIIALMFMFVLLVSYSDRHLWGVLTPATAADSGGASMRVKTYAEIVPGAASGPGARTANAWADGATMQSQSVASTDALHAEAQAAWPEVPASSASSLPASQPTAPAVSEPAELTPAEFYVTQPLANVRAGPSTEHALLQTAGAGAHFPITGKWMGLGGDWWQIDTGHGLAWIHSALGAATGHTQGIALIANPPAPPVVAVVSAQNEPSAPPATVAPPLVATATPLPASFTYSVETVQRHSEANTVVIYGYVHERGLARDSAYLWVSHNGATYRSGPSSALIAGTTKPSATNSPENVAYNVKIDFPVFLYPAVEMSGEWTIVLVDGNNQALSPVTVVTIAPDDSRRELYLRFRKN